MSWWMIVLIVLGVLCVAMIVLYKVGDNLQKKQISQKEQMAEAAQPVTMLVIDKKIIPMKDANLPKAVMEQTPKRYQKAKLPIVKAKIGPQIMNLICDDAIYDDVPTKGEVKAMLSGIYIMSIKSVRNNNKKVVDEEPKKKKLFNFGNKMHERQAEYQKQINAEVMSNRKAKKAAGASSEKTKEQLKKEKARAKKITDGIK